MARFDIAGIKWLRRKKPTETRITNTEISAGAYGGAIPRIFPTNVPNVFTHLHGGGVITSGIRQPRAFRPPSAAMLSSADYHSNVSATGRTKNMPTVPFTRQSVDIVPAAVTDATHLRGVVHPAVRRAVLRGKEAL